MGTLDFSISLEMIYIFKAFDLNLRHLIGLKHNLNESAVYISGEHGKPPLKYRSASLQPQ